MKMILTLEDYVEALAFIAQSEVLAYDVETTGLNVRKDRVIGFGISNALDGLYIPLLSYSPNVGKLLPTSIKPAFVRHILESLKAKKLIMFNASFDARITKNNLGVDLLPALHADVLLMKHTCDEEFPFGLKEIATKLFGLDAQAEKQAMLASIKVNGGSASQYFKADTQILAKYCVQDCKLTYRLFDHYSRELERDGLTDFYYRDEVLPLYKEVTIPMEERGVQLDMNLLNQSLVDIDQDLVRLESQIQEAISPILSVFTSWFLNKDYPIKTFTGKPTAWTKKYTSQMEAWKADNPSGYMFNLLSKHHLKKLFFDTLKETPLSRTPTGQPQVDEEFLESVAHKYDWVSKLIEFNKLTKLKGTYILRLLEESENGKFYPSFQQHRTVSGRYAGDLQQLPRPLESGSSSPLVIKHNNRIREFIVPSPNHKLVSADYEQLEPSIFAHTSGDLALQQIFQKGTDFYSEVAIRTERLEGVSSDKSAVSYLGKVNKAARQKAKAYSLGIAYGMTGYKLKFEINCDDATAEQLVKDYLAAFPQLAKWMYESKEQIKKFGHIKTQSGRIRRMPQAFTLYKKYGPCIEDDLELWKAFNKNPTVYELAKKDRKVFKNLLNNSINFQVQGLAASIVNRASIAIVRELRQKGLQSAIVMQVHDEIVLDVLESELDQVCEIVKRVMESIVTLAVPLRTVPQTGTNFRECK